MKKKRLYCVPTAKAVNTSLRTGLLSGSTLTVVPTKPGETPAPEGETLSGPGGGTTDNFNDGNARKRMLEF